MSLKSVLKPDASVLVGLANAAIVVAIYQGSLPPNADIRVGTKPHDQNIDSSRKAAAWKAAAVLGLVFLMTRDVNSALIGGAVLAAEDYHVKHSNGIDPKSGKLTAAPGGSIMTGGSAGMGNADAFPLPDYGDGS